MNTIVEGNLLGSGVHFSAYPNVPPSYCDFFNDQGPNFSGEGIPPNLGQIVTVNANGDSCDNLYNIFRNPRYQTNIGDSAFRLRSNSPCIDAGDPTFPLNLDGTIADIGAYYHHYGPGMFTLSITPHSQNIIIPSTGGSFVFDAHIMNTTARTLFFDAWSEVIDNYGRTVSPVLLRRNLSINTASTIIREVTQYVPGSAPWGNYRYRVNIGIYPDSTVDADSLSFLKWPGLDAIGKGGGWNTHGWTVFGWDENTDAASIQHSSFGILHSYPNPFNASTALSFKMQAASNVKLAVYDVSGREVSVLVEGYHNAGTHRTVWDASTVSSGVYFAKLTAPGSTQTQKLLLVK